VGQASLLIQLKRIMWSDYAMKWFNLHHIQGNHDGKSGVCGNISCNGVAFIGGQAFFIKKATGNGGFLGADAA
jgi:hypothetical protein